MLTGLTQALALWGPRHDALNGALESRLVRSPSILKSVITLLRSVLIRTGRFNSSHIGDGKGTDASGEACSATPHCKEEQEQSSGTHLSRHEHEDCGIPEGEDETLENQLDDINIYVQCLIDMDSVFSDPIEDLDHGPAEEGSALSHHQLYALRIMELFPTISQSMADILAAANSRRHQHVHEQWEEAGIRMDHESVISYVVPADPSGLLLYRPEENGGKGLVQQKHLDTSVNLQPYVCFFPECDFGGEAFSDRASWLSHMGETTARYPF